MPAPFPSHTATAFPLRFAALALLCLATISSVTIPSLFITTFAAPPTKSTPPLTPIAPLTSTKSTQPAESIPPTPDARIEQLRAEIKRHDDLYYKKTAPEIPDATYDALKRELLALEAAHPALAATDSPTRRIDDDAPDTFFRHHPHRVPMLSIDNTYTTAGIRAFDQRVRKQLAAHLSAALPPAPTPPSASTLSSTPALPSPSASASARPSAATLRYTIEPKIDGAGISLIYEHGKLTRVLTRGDGAGGDDIIANTRAIRALPRQLRDDGGGLPALIEIRGEIHIAFADFERINEQRAAAGLPPFANPRNLAAGTMKLHNPAEADDRALRILVYGVGACDPGPAMPAPPATQRDLLERFRAWGLPVIEKYWLATTPDELDAAIAELAALRPALPYPIDGAVVKVDDFAAQRILGAHATAPRWAIAFKYTPKNAETRVRSILLQVGRTGALTPVAELDPVTFDGSKITRVTLHNTQELLRKDVRPGDIVILEKAGDVIPVIARVKTEARPASAAHPAPFVLPKNCPACGTPLVSADNANNTTNNNNTPAAPLTITAASPTTITTNTTTITFPTAAAANTLTITTTTTNTTAAAIANDSPLRCPDRDCPAQVKARIAYFASKPCVNIAGLGEATVDKLVTRGLARDAAALYDLTPAQLAALDGLGEKTAARLHAAIAASRRAELWRVLVGLGLPDVAATRAKTLAKRYDTLAALAAANEPDIAKLPGLGKKAAASIAAWLSDPTNRALLQRIEAHRAPAHS